MLNWSSASAHRRYNPLRGDWILVSPQRLARPWQGQTDAPAREARPAYDPHCYLCPGNVRANGAHNPKYETTFAFDNDFPALEPSNAQTQIAQDGLFIAQSESGRCRVVCFSPAHDLDIAQMDRSQIRAVLDEFAREYGRLGQDPGVRAVTIFENRGAAMGASNLHPHGQVWANATIPNELAREDDALRRYDDEHGECMLCRYVRREVEAGERIVYADEHVCIVVPYWAEWPFETLVVPRAHAGALDAIGSSERDGLAQGIRQLALRYDRLFVQQFPYSMGFHQQPTDGAAYGHFHVHAHYYPPLLRSASIRKFMVGYELLAQPQRDITPEEAAQRLREA